MRIVLCSVGSSAGGSVELAQDRNCAKMAKAIRKGRVGGIDGTKSPIRCDAGNLWIIIF